VALFFSGPAEDDPEAAVYGERQMVATPGHYKVTFRARERHVTEWTELTESTPATVDAGPASDIKGYWDPQLRYVSASQKRSQHLSGPLVGNRRQASRLE